MDGERVAIFGEKEVNRKMAIPSGGIDGNMMRRQPKPVRYGISVRTIINIESRVVPGDNIIRAKHLLNGIVNAVRRKNILACIDDSLRSKVMFFWQTWQFLSRDNNKFRFYVKHDKSPAVFLPIVRKSCPFTTAITMRMLDDNSISLLFLILAKKFDLPIYLVSGPERLFVRWQDNKHTFNFINGEPASNRKAKELLGISDEAVKKGVYFKNLTASEVKAVLYFNRALEYIVNQRAGTREAIKDLNTAIRMKQNDPEAHFARALAYLQLGNDELAYLDLTIAAQLDPYYSKAYSKMIALDMKSKKTSTARDEYLKTFKLGPAVLRARNLKMVDRGTKPDQNRSSKS